MESILSIVPCLWDCTGKQLRYICRLEDNLQILAVERDGLNNRCRDVNRKVETEEGRYRRRTEQVRGWLEQVETLKNEVDEILQMGEREIHNKCWGICCPKNCWSSYKLGKVVLTKIVAVKRLVEMGEIDNVTSRLPVDKMCSEETEGFDSKHARDIHILEDNLETLDIAVGELSDLFQDVKINVEADEKKNMRRTKEVSGWLERVEIVKSKVTEIIQEGSKELQNNALGICCTENYCSSHYLKEEVSKKLGEVRGLTENGHFERVAFKITPTIRVDKMCLEETVGLDAKFQEIWRWIEDKNVGIVGLYGIGGVGKTSLLKKINNQFLNVSHDFDDVIWVTVSKTSDVGNIQGVIRKKLGVTDKEWNEKGEECERAGVLSSILEQRKFVLLLDDLWEHFELSQIGIPNPSKTENACKLILTTRSEEVCRHMHAQNEAVRFFLSKLGEDILKLHPDIPRLAEAVAKECHGIPLALITTGRAMAGVRNPKEWEFAIDRLRTNPADFAGIGREVFHKLKFSYDQLHDEKLQKCFLYCAIFPEDHNILNHQLIHLWLGEGFLDKKNDVNVALNEGEYIINIFKALMFIGAR